MSSFLLDDDNKVASSKFTIKMIKDYILKNKLKPGDLIPSELELSKEFNVSKSTVREAIKMLEILGIVKIKRGIGTIFSDNSYLGFINVLFFQLAFQQNDTAEFIEFRRMFEIAYTKLAAENANQEDFYNIKDTIIKYEENIQFGIVNVQDDLDFHQKILEATHNDFIISLGSAINSIYANSIEASVKYRPEIAIKDHYSIYNAMLNKDFDNIEKTINNSIELWKDFLIK